MLDYNPGSLDNNIAEPEPNMTLIQMIVVPSIDFWENIAPLDELHFILKDSVQ